MTFSLKPGSVEATEQGCLCPNLENHWGKGYLGDGGKFGWVINGNCPLHGMKEDKANENN